MTRVPRPPRATWARGKRRQHRRQAGLAVVAACALGLVVASATVLVHLDPSPGPAIGTRDAPRLPDKVFPPSPWLSGTSKGGPLGPLAMVIPATRETLFGHSSGYVGVPMSSGDYRFLDLPEVDDQADPALSPDGRHVAYWLHGSGEFVKAIVGVGVYDTTTGRTVRHPIPTRYGLEPTGGAGDAGLGWLDNNELLLSYGKFMGGSGFLAHEFRQAPMQALTADRVGSLRVYRQRGTEPALLGSGKEVQLSPDGHFLYQVGSPQRRVQQVRPAGPMPASTLNHPIEGVVALSPDGSRVAALLDDDGPDGGGGPGEVGVGTVAGEKIDLNPVGSKKVRAVLGWRDDNHVVVLLDGPELGDESDPNAQISLSWYVDSVDTRNGARTRLSTVIGYQPVFSAASLTGRVFQASKPHAVNLRVAASLGLVGILALGLLGLLGVAGFVRRRRV